MGLRPRHISNGGVGKAVGHLPFASAPDDTTLAYKRSRKTIGSLRVTLREMVRLRSVRTTLRACLTLRFSHLYGSLASLNVSPFVSPSGYVSDGRGTHGTPGVDGLLHTKARVF